MPPIAFLRGWLLILLPMLFICFDYGTFSNFVSQRIQHLSTQDFLRLSDMLIDYLPKRWRPGPSIEDIHLLNIACLFIIWRTVLNVKRRIDQWEEHQVQRMHTEINAVINERKDLQKTMNVLRQRLKGYTSTVASTKLNIGELKESCKAYTAQIVGMEEENDELKANLEQEKKIFDTDRETLEKKLEMTTNLLQEKEQTLQQKRAQEEQLHRERETKLQEEIKTFETSIMDMTTEREKSEDSYKTQTKELERRIADLENSLSSSRYDNEMLKESLTACCRTSAKSAEELYGLQKGFEQECQIQHGAINSLKTQLERMTNELQDAEITLKKELAEKEASTVQTNEQFLACKEGIRKVAKERQHFLKDEIRLHQNKAHENWVAYREADRALAREKKKTADLHRKLEELNNKLAENFGKSQKPQASLQKKDVSTENGQPSTHKGHPSSRNNHPSTRNGHPSTSSGHSSMSSGHPSTRNDHPSMLNSHPSTNSCHPSTYNGHPSNYNGHRSTTTRWAVDQDRDRRQRSEGWTSFRCRKEYQKNPAPDNS